MLFHSRAADSRERVLFYFGVRPLFFDAGVCPSTPYLFHHKKKKIVEGEKNRETWPS
jgi:hypothetical protein